MDFKSFNTIPIVLLILSGLSCSSGSDDVLNSAMQLEVQDFNITSTYEMSSTSLSYNLYDLIAMVPIAPFNNYVGTYDISGEIDFSEEGVEGCSLNFSNYFDNQDYFILRLDDTPINTRDCLGAEFDRTWTLSFFYKIQFIDQSGESIRFPLEDDMLDFGETSSVVAVNTLTRSATFYPKPTEQELSEMAENYPSYEIVNEMEEGDGYEYSATYSIYDFNESCNQSQYLITNCVVEEVSRLHGLRVTLDTQMIYHTEYYRKRIEVNDLVPVEDAPFFESGTIDFIYENWTGTITFHGAYISPSYTATNGEETVDGIIEVPNYVVP